MRPGVLLLVLSIALSTSCNSGSDTPSEKSESTKEDAVKSAKGESCGKSADCEEGLRCIDLKCVEPEGATNKEASPEPSESGSLPSETDPPAEIEEAKPVEVEQPKSLDLVVPPSMALIPAGEFTMGNNLQGAAAAVELCKGTFGEPEKCVLKWYIEEVPRHSVLLGSFLIDQLEVTNQQYQGCVDAGTCKKINYSDCSLYKNVARNAKAIPAELKQGDHPAVCVSWEQADTYCQWNNKRLPTEAEWERAASGGIGNIFPWGDEWGVSYANWGEKAGWGDNDGYKYTSPPGSFPSGLTKEGVADLSGNVWEWTGDWYHVDNYLERRFPLGASSGADRISRGGSYRVSSGAMRAQSKLLVKDGKADISVGFRCAGPSISDYQKLCTDGDISVCARLGERTLQGIGTPKDEVKAAQYFKQACDGGDSDACYELAGMYYRGVGMPKDSALAMALYKSICEAGDADGCQMVGSMFLVKSDMKDDAKVAEYWKRSCELALDYPSRETWSVESACDYLGYCYSAGECGMPKDSKLGQMYYEKAMQAQQANCNKGYSSSCLSAALTLWKGQKGYSQEGMKAASYFEKACETGDYTYCGIASSIYIDGDIVSQNFGEALRLSKLACDAGNSSGCYLHGNCYLLGYGVARNNSEAARYFEESCNSENPDKDACYKAAVLYGAGIEMTIDFKRSLKVCQQGLRAGRR